MNRRYSQRLLADGYYINSKYSSGIRTEDDEYYNEEVGKSAFGERRRSCFKERKEDENGELINQNGIYENREKESHNNKNQFIYYKNKSNSNNYKNNYDDNYFYSSAKRPQNLFNQRIDNNHRDPTENYPKNYFNYNKNGFCSYKNQNYNSRSIVNTIYQSNFRMTEKPYSNYSGYYNWRDDFTYENQQYGNKSFHFNWNQRFKSKNSYQKKNYFCDDFNSHYNQKKYSDYGNEEENTPIKKRRLEKILQNIRYEINNYDGLTSKSIISIINILLKENFNRIEAMKADYHNIEDEFAKQFPKLKLHQKKEESGERKTEEKEAEEQIIMDEEVDVPKDEEEIFQGARKPKSLYGKRNAYSTILNYDDICLNELDIKRNLPMSSKLQFAVSNEVINPQNNKEENPIGKVHRGKSSVNKTSKSSLIISLQSQKLSKSTSLSSRRNINFKFLLQQSGKSVALKTQEEKSLKAKNSNGQLGSCSENSKEEIDLDNPIVTKEKYFDYYFYTKFTQNSLWEFLNSGNNIIYLLSDSLFLSLVKPYLDCIANNEFMRTLFLKKTLKTPELCYTNAIRFIEKVLVKSPRVPQFMQEFIIENFNCLSQRQYSSHFIKVFLGKIEKLNEQQSLVIAEKIAKDFDNYTKNIFSCGVLISVLYVRV